MKAKSSRKPRVKAALPPEPQPPVMQTKPSWLKEICTAQVSSAIAIAFVVFAAGSAAAMTQAAVPELSSYADTSVISFAHLQSQVLGASTAAIDDSALEAADPSAYIFAKPVSFDSTAGRWDYNIYYSVSNLAGSGTLTIGTYVVASGITATGTVETGAILKPDMTYHVSMWDVDSSGNKQNLAHIEIKTKKGTTTKTTTPPAPCLQPQSSPMSNSTPTVIPKFCIKKDDGTVQCVPSTCIMLPPMGTASGTPPQPFIHWEYNPEMGSSTLPGYPPSKGTGTPPALPSHR